MPEQTPTGQTSVYALPGSVAAASNIAQTLTLERAPNGLRYASFGDTRVEPADLSRLMAAVPATVAPALSNRAFYFAPLVLAATAETAEVLVSSSYTAELADEAICHRDVKLAPHAETPAHEGVFISARLLRDRFALAFELFINVAHAFAATGGVPAAFSALAWQQAEAGVRGETSQDAFEARAEALPPAPSGKNAQPRQPDEKARLEFFEAAFADALAIYMLSLAVDFDYSELREREYPLLAPPALAARLKLMAELFPPNDGYEFSIRYRRK